MQIRFGRIYTANLDIEGAATTRHKILYDERITSEHTDTMSRHRYDKQSNKPSKEEIGDAKKTNEKKK